MLDTFDFRERVSSPEGEAFPSARGGASRRAFLRRSASVAGPAALLAGSSMAEGSSSATSTTGLFPAVGGANWLHDHFLNIVNSENTHLEALLNELGTNARPKPTFQNLTPANIQAFASMGSMFCSTGAGAYLGAAPFISNPYLFAQASSIGQVELTQSGYLNSILGLPFLTGGSPFSVALTLNEVIFRAAPFIASLNGGPAPYFSTTEKSLENDIAILNTALILEYLEHDFYNMNFPRFFP